MRRSIDGSRPKTIPINKIRLDGDTQSRLRVNEDVVSDYAAAMKDGREFPPLSVVFDGRDYWLFDGFHRRWSAVKAGIDKFKCFVTDGTREDARWLSYSANTDHGLQRTNEDKRRAVIAALKHPKGAKLSDRQIAEHVGVSPPTVGRYRELTVKDLQSHDRTGRDGRTINTANIGKTAPESDDELVEASDDTDVEPEEPVAPKETNTIGAAKESIDAFIERLIDGKPAHFRMAVADHLVEMASLLRT